MSQHPHINESAYTKMRRAEYFNYFEHTAWSDFFSKRNDVWEKAC
jgi:hypothetical protein